MNQFSCFIVEDDPQALDYTTNIINEQDGINILGHSPSIKDAALQILQKKPDFIILDVYLEDGTAFEFLELFEEINFRIIFTTSFAKHAIEAFKFSAIDYLLKPFHPDELKTSIQKVKEVISKENYHSQLDTLLYNFSNSNEAKKIVLKNSDAIFIVHIKDILFAKSNNNYTIFFLNNSTEVITSKPLKSYEDKLVPNGFFRSHQSYLINLSLVTKFNKRTEELILNEKHAIPVSQSKKSELLKIISKQF